jgi:hypothetical protein
MFVIPAIALMLLSPSELKCSRSSTATMPGYELGEPVVLVDAVVTRRSDVEALNPEEVAWVGILCWSPSTNSIQHLGNGISVIWIITKTTIEATRAPLLQLIKAQEDFRGRHQRYASDLESLESFGVNTDIDVEFEGSDSRWNASSPSENVMYRCSANETSVSTVGKDGQPQPDCAPVEPLALRALRAHYDAGL